MDAVKDLSCLVFNPRSLLGETFRVTGDRDPETGDAQRHRK